MSLESRKLIFPNANFGNNLDDLGRKQIHDVSRADFGRPEVEAHATAVSKVAWVDEASGADCSACSIAWEVV